MKQDPISKLYASLTSKEQAALSFDYLMKGDELEQSRIASAMPMQHFTGFPLEYRQTLDGMGMVAMLYAIEHWRNVAMVNIYLAGAVAKSANAIAATRFLGDEAALQCAEYQEWRATVDALENHETMLHSIEAAIDELCAEHAISPAAIRKMAGTRVYAPIQPDLKADADAVAELRGCWARALAPYPPAPTGALPGTWLRG